MENISNYIYSAIVGFVITVIGNFIITYRYSKQKSKIKKSVSEKVREENLWKSMNMGVRQAITNEYIFSVLMYLFIGNLIWIATEIISPLLDQFSHGIYLLLNSFGLVSGVVFFFLGFMRIKRYLSLRALDNHEDIERIIAKKQ